MKKTILFAMIFVFFACSSEEKITNDFLFEEYKNGDIITLENVNGGSKTIIRTQNGFVVKGEEDKILIFDFFGTFCAPCKEEAPHLTAFSKKYKDKLILIGLTHFENVDDDAVRQFATDYGAFYFLSNSKENSRIINQALKDINYQSMEALPFKVVLKNGIYQALSDFWNKGYKTKFYLGKIPTEFIENDIKNIF